MPLLLVLITSANKEESCISAVSLLGFASRTGWYPLTSHSSTRLRREVSFRKREESLHDENCLFAQLLLWQQEGDRVSDGIPPMEKREV